MWLFLGLLVTSCFCFTSLFLIDWSNQDDQALYSTASIGIGGVMLGALVQHYAGLSVTTNTVVTIMLVIVLTVLAWRIAISKSSQPLDITDGVKISDGKDAVDTKPGDSFDITIKLPESRDTLTLRMDAEDLDPATGADCVPDSWLYLTGAGIGEGELRVHSDGTATISIEGFRNSVRLQARIESGSECRIRITPARAVIA
ncbi:hypothetical protein ACW4TU_41455 [Streptomyces sp. QTS52]